MGNTALHQDTSIAANPYRSSLPWRPRHRGAITCQFDKSRQANTQQLRVSLSTALALLLPVTSIISQGERPLKCRLVIPTIIGRTYYRFIREGIRGNKVTAAYLSRIKVQLMRNTINSTFQDIRGLWSTRPTIGSRRHLVGIHT